MSILLLLGFSDVRPEFTEMLERLKTACEAQGLARSGGILEVTNFSDGRSYVSAGRISFVVSRNGQLESFANDDAGPSFENGLMDPKEEVQEAKYIDSLRAIMLAGKMVDYQLQFVHRDKNLSYDYLPKILARREMEFRFASERVPIFKSSLSVTFNRRTGQVMSLSSGVRELILPPRSFKPEVGPESAEGTALARHAKWFPESSPNEISTELVILPEADQPMESSEKWFDSYLTGTRKKDFEEGRGVLAWVSFIGGERGPFVRCTTDAITGQVLWVFGQDTSGRIGGYGKLAAPPISYGEGTWSVTVNGKTKKLWADLQPVRFVPAKKNSQSLLLRRGKLLFRLNPTANPNVYTDTASKLSYQLVW